MWRAFEEERLAKNALTHVIRLDLGAPCKVLAIALDGFFHVAVCGAEKARKAGVGHDCAGAFVGVWGVCVYVAYGRGGWSECDRGLVSARRGPRADPLGRGRGGRMGISCHGAGILLQRSHSGIGTFSCVRTFTPRGAVAPAMFSKDQQ